MPDPEPHIPRGIDTSEPHSARIYDFWLGGKDHYPVDRAVGEQIRSALPVIGDMAVKNRAFLKRAVRPRPRSTQSLKGTHRTPAVKVWLT